MAMKLVWLRRDLRSVDNTALNHAIATSQEVVACFVATPLQWRDHHMAPMQADLIARRLAVLAEELNALNIPLLYDEVDDYAQSATRVANWAEQLAVSEVVFNREYEVNERVRDEQLINQLASSEIGVLDVEDKCAQAPGCVLNKQGDYFKVFTPFKKAWLKSFVPPQIIKTSAAQPVVLPEALQSSLWHEQAPFSYPRQSSEAWSVDSHQIRETLRRFCHEEVDRYHEQRDFPATAGTSVLSPYLAIGAISVRQCIARLYWQQSYLSNGREVWLSELIWREFYHHLIHFEPKLVKGQGFVEWEKHLLWPAKPDWFDRWCRGETGYPIVDAAMRQLNQTGWMHNRLRMIVASFLTKDLHVNWRLGEQYFMQKLVDGDFAANNGGWQWCASTGCDGQPYFRIFNPITQGEKFDPNGEFVKYWLPELAQVPSKFVHQPWNWPGHMQLDYPAPMVDHKQEREITLSLYTQAKDCL
ncbi:TPA: deoxyribodipyrimidine photo-lyase [Vibrio vulnificus]|nr:deoxyribodipyrimidine photo-lyase [Vibrio vulnificus]HAS6294407.1 deoxyribodipyrimidine photo-lyase [Vibrio vulnificus]HAS6295584.1 deoxyribodipyrimidine photo-lyase [Vibrio vulnificus]HAS6317306.1 deoxyribodipyrimidine photo-lyase [Vibrio vulnificus]HAS6318676.1 deoxyribodipyrimidine photo-lyase [Vibrio vulnificus]